MKTTFVLSLLALAVFAEAAKTAPHPKYLDKLLREKRYEEFSDLMGISDVELSRPGNKKNPMFNPELDGDIMLQEDQDPEEARQGIRFEKYGGSKWQNRIVPYYISGDFNSNERTTIQNSLNRWNQQINCIKMVQWNNHQDYVYVFPGNGCWSALGRRGGGQSLSLQRNGCVSQGTVLHEFEHAIGFAHEHNRSDRDNFVRILWDNIPENWKSQYEKTNPNDYGLQATYDYYSLMHYPYNAPETNKPAFQILRNGVDTNRLGRGNDFTNTDRQKICELYR